MSQAVIDSFPTGRMDGAMRYTNPPDPVYAPNSFGGPKADPAYELPSWQSEAGEIGRTAYVKHANDDDFGQPGTLYREVLSGTDRDHLVTNIVGHLKDAVKPDLQQRAVQYWAQVDAALGARIRATLEGNRGALEGAGAAVEDSKVVR